MLTREQQIRNGMLYITRLAVTALLPLIALPIFTRVLTRADYGVLALVQIYAMFASALANAGLITAFDRNFFEQNRVEGRLALLGSVVTLVACLTGFIGLGTYLFRGALAAWFAHSGEYGDLLFCAYCSMGITAINQYYLTYLRNSERAMAHLLFGICEVLIGFVVSLVLVVVVRMGVTGLVLGQLTGAGITLVFMNVFVFAGTRPRGDVALLGDCLRIGLPLTPRIFIGVLNNQFDKYMIGVLRAAGSVGFYSIGQMFGYAVFMLMTALQNVFSPQVYQRMFTLGADGGRAVGKYLTPFVYISVGAGLLVALFAEDVITILLPASFHGSIEIAMILACYYAILFFGKQPQAVYAKKTYLIPILSVFGVGVNIGLNILFIARWGALGAAWATLAAGLISGSVSFVVSQRCYRIDWEYGSLCSMYAVMFIAMLGVLVMRAAGVGYVVKVGFKLLMLACFAGVGARCGVLRRESLVLLLESLSGKGDHGNAADSDG